MAAPGMTSATQSNQGGGNRFRKFFRRNSKGAELTPATDAKIATSNNVSDSEHARPIPPKRRSLRQNKKNKKGLLGGLLPVVKSKTEESTTREKSPSPETPSEPAIPLQHERVRLNASVSNPQINTHGESSSIVERIESIRPISSEPSNKSSRKSLVGNDSLRSGKSWSNNRAPAPSQSSSAEQVEQTPEDREGLFQWQDNVDRQEELALIHQKQLIKERDGFCRRVDAYDGSIIRVEGKPAYELGNYLGGGVAGVVYEAHRLLGPEEYPVRLGIPEERAPLEIEARTSSVPIRQSPSEKAAPIALNSFLCSPVHAKDAVADNESDENLHVGIIEPPGVRDVRNVATNITMKQKMEVRDASLLTMDSSYAGTQRSNVATHTNDVALEATASADGNKVIIDSIDAPSRSKHYARAVTSQHTAQDEDFPCDASFVNDFMEESVAVKILNPVGFRILSTDVTNAAVVAKEGVIVDKEIYDGVRPMEEKHVWWLVNPSSRNLRTLQRYMPDGAIPAGMQVDRGCASKGLRISLIAAFKDTDGNIKELPLTRCIEIWGHIPFEASDTEFKEVMTALDRVNQGLPPLPIPGYLSKLIDVHRDGITRDEAMPGRIGTGTSSMTGSLTNSLDDLKLTANNTQFKSNRTGIYRAAYSERQTVYCEELQAYIAIPAVPSKYIKWLRQRRAATKEVRNMTKMGRHKNVVHLFEVLELIQDTKSTMFLILELVRGGELFDLISSNAAKISNHDIIPKGFSESETVMRKFFFELVSGIHYCHSNFIAHRDLKPENLLVHYDNNQTACTLKIADFGLSATFGPNGESLSDHETIMESLTAPQVESKIEPMELPTAAVSPIKQHMDKILNVGGTALSFFTCGNVDDILANCGALNKVDKESKAYETPLVTLKRMTSVVGSPHYVAPEIISQQDKKTTKKKVDGEEQIIKGYDGTKADVWSAGVILYAMLFRSLPFGEDLLRCPRYQSYKKWYDDIRMTGGPRSRRGNILAPLNPIITAIEEQEYLGPHWFFPSESSPESRDLIVYMLSPDPDKRPSIDLVLKHPWLLKKGSPW